MTVQSRATVWPPVSNGATLSAERVLIPDIDIGPELGRGARSVVFLGRRDGVEYAVKVLNQVGTDTDAAQVRREASLLACIQHPGLVRVHEVGETAGHPYLVMDLVDGRSLASSLRVTRLAEPAVVQLAMEAADALAAAHRIGLVHRDIKPDNIMLASDGSVRIIDFGLAAHAGAVAGDVAVGTFTYSAPEQTGVLHRAVDGRADLYALGVVLFECLAGRPPFVADDVGSLIRLHLSATPPDLSATAPDTSAAFAAVVGKLLAKDPDDRYQTAGGLYADLARIVVGDTDAFVPGSTDRPDGSSDPKLIGRGGELVLVRARWAQAAAGSGGAVLITGAPGQGKSRLVREFVTGVAAAGVLAISGKCGADNAAPMAAVRDALETYVQDLRRRPEPQRSAALGRLRAVVGDTAEVLKSLTPALAEVLADAPDSADWQHGGRLVEGIAALLIGLAHEHRGLVVHIDDVQWCDEGSIRVLRRLAADLHDAPLLLVLCGRDDADSAEQVARISADLGATLDLHVAVGPLDDGAVAQLIAGQLGSYAVPAALASRVARRSGGSPMAVLEHLRAVLDAGLLQPSWGTWLLDDEALEALALPADVLNLVLRRVDALGETVHRLLTVAATVGGRFTLDVVTAVAGTGRVAALSAFAVAAGHQLIERTGTTGYRFLHDRIREALLAPVGEADRQVLHRRIAEELERAGRRDAETIYQIAGHYLAGETQARPESVFRAAWAAGSLALTQFVPGDALDFLTKAASAAVVASIAPDASFDAELGQAAWQVGELALAADALQRALTSESDQVRRARLYLLLATVEAARWDTVQAIGFSKRGLAEIGHPLPRYPVAMVVTTLALLVWGVILGRVPQRWRQVDAARAERMQVRAELMNKIAHSAALSANYPLASAMDIRSLHLTQHLRPGPQHVTTLSGLAMPLAAIGLRGPSGRLFDKALAYAANLGEASLTARVMFNRAFAIDAMQPIGPATGTVMRQVLADYGRWLDFDEYTTGAGFIEQTDLLRGHCQRADELDAKVVARVRGENGALVGPLASTAAQIAALSGLPAEAARQLDIVRGARTEAPGNSALAASVALAAVAVAVEQGEYGAVFERAMDEFRALHLKIDDGPHIFRGFWVHRAFGRLAQVVANPQRRDAHLMAAGEAVAELGKVVKGSLLRAYHQAALAGLQQLRGDHLGALRLLHRLDSWSDALDAPLVEYEVARIRARALRATGRAAASHLQARVALLLASDHGWLVRARWVRAEFDLDVGSYTPSSRTASRADARWAGSSAEQLPERRARAIRQVGAAAASVLDPVQVARIALDEIIGTFAAERAFVFLAEDDGDVLAPFLGRDGGGQDLAEFTGYGSTLVQRVHDTGEPLVVTGSDQGAALGSRSALVHGLRSIMVAPLMLGGRAFGVVYLDSRVAKGIFTTEDVGVLASITNHIATSLETARAAQLELAVHAARRERDVAQLLRNAMTELAGSREPGDLARRLITIAAQVLPVSSAVLLQHAGEGATRLAAIATRTGTGGEQRLKVTILAADTAPLDPADDPVLRDVLAREAASHGDGSPPLPAQLGTDVAYWAAFPLWVRGTRLATLLVGTTERRPYSDAEREIASTLAGQGAVALENALLFRQVEDLAIRDGLTELFNRRHFFKIARTRIDAGRRSHQQVGAIMIDIDNFKRINDTYGHSIGDEVIREVAARLAGTLRTSDIICRYGGEEFAVILPETPTEPARVAAERLHEAIRSEPVSTQAGLLRVTVSIGLAHLERGGQSAEELLARADLALYAAKRDGRDRIARQPPDLVPANAG